MSIRVITRLAKVSRELTHRVAQNPQVLLHRIINSKLELLAAQLFKKNMITNIHYWTVPTRWENSKKVK